MKIRVANTNLGLDLHSSSPEPVNFFGAQSSLAGAQFSFGGHKQSFGTVLSTQRLWHNSSPPKYATAFYPIHVNLCVPIYPIKILILILIILCKQLSRQLKSMPVSKQCLDNKRGSNKNRGLPKACLYRCKIRGGVLEDVLSLEDTF